METNWMTWSRFDDAAPTHPKAKEAGNEAWGLWCAAVMYCNRYLTDGFVSLRALSRDCLPVPIKEAKAKALATRLVNARVGQEGKGLFTETEGGYLVNDFLDWNPSKSDVETKRKADRDRKRNPKGIQVDSARNPDGSPTESDGNPGGVALDSSGASPARGPAPAGAGVPAIPAIPAVPSPPQQQRGKQACPADLELAPAQRATLESGGVPAWCTDEITKTYRAKYAGNVNESRTLDQWRRGLVTTIQGTMNDPSKRPRKPASASEKPEPIDIRAMGAKAGADGL